MRPEIWAWHYSTDDATTALVLGARYRARSRILRLRHYPSNRYPQAILHVRGHFMIVVALPSAPYDLGLTWHLLHMITAKLALRHCPSQPSTHRPISKIRSDRPDDCASSFTITISIYTPCVVSRFAVDYHACAELPSSRRLLPRSQQSTIKSNQKQDFPPPATVGRSLLQAYRQHV